MDNIIELAKQAGFFLGDSPEWDATKECYERFAILVRNAALEEAAQKCRSYTKWVHWGQIENYVLANRGAQDCAEAIESLKEPIP